MAKKLISMRLSALTETQLTELTSKLGMNRTEVVTMAVNEYYKKLEEKMLINAVKRVIERLPHWNEDAVIYRYVDDGVIAASPLSTYEAIARDSDVEVIIRVHDLDEFGDTEITTVDAPAIAQMIQDGCL